MVKVRKREILGWAFFDVANSSYTTVIITISFGIIFSQLIHGPTEGASEPFARGNFLWSITLATSWLITAILGPLFGALSDVSTSRKRFLAFSVVLCSVATALFYLLSPGDVWAASFLLIISNIGFSLSENFISAFLPHISTPENVGKISGLGWGLGYLGGLLSVILAFLVTGFIYTQENYYALRLIGPITASFFVIFSIPTFLFVKEPPKALDHVKRSSKAIRKAYAEIIHTLRNLHEFRDLARFLLSFFFFQGGLSIVISFAALYGEQVVQLKGSWQLIFFVSLQLTACLGALFFGFIQDKIGALKSINITLIIWILTILSIYLLKPIADFFKINNLPLAFIIVANFAGLCLGATQASSRAVVGAFSPPSRSGEFYGFWGLAGKMAAVFSMVLFGAMQYLFSLQIAMLMCSIFFILGLVMNRSVNETRGIQNAKSKG